MPYCQFLRLAEQNFLARAKNINSVLDLRVLLYAGCGRRVRCCATCATMEYPAPSGRNTGKTVPTSQYAAIEDGYVSFQYLSTNQPHCKENPIYVFPEKELRGLSPGFHIHVSLSNYILPGSVHIFSCSRIGRPNILLCYGILSRRRLLCEGILMPTNRR
jgi:hypothetical protein